MPIIEENMMDTNVGAMSVPSVDLKPSQGLQTVGNTVSDIMTDMIAKRTETETKNFLGAYGHTSALIEEDNFQKLKSDPNLNWNTDGETIKKNYLEGMKTVANDFREKAPNEIAKRELLLQNEKDYTSATLRLNALHTQKVLEQNEKLYTEIGGSTIAQMPFGVDAASADQSYKKAATDLMKLGSVPFSNPDKLREREKWFVTNYTEKFVNDGAVDNPARTLRTLSPDVARYLEQHTLKGMTSMDNGLADIAFKGKDGAFYQFRYNVQGGKYDTIRSSLDPSLYKDAFLVNLSNKEVVLDEKKVTQSPQTPTFVKELIRLNPEKYMDYTQLLMKRMLVRKKEDVSLNKQAVKDTYKNTMSGKLTSAEYQRLDNIIGDTALFNSEDNMGKVETAHKILAPYIVGNTVFELRKDPTMTPETMDALKKDVTNKFNAISNDTESPKVQALFAQLSPTQDVEEGREMYKANSKALLAATLQDITNKQEEFKAEFKKDAGAYVRSIRSPEDQTRYDNFFGGPDPLIFKDVVSPSDMAKLKVLATEDQFKLKKWNSDLGLSSSIMTKEEEKKLVDYVKANTSNPERVTNAITRLQEVMGNKATSEFLDRSGLGFYRSMFATSSFALQSDLSQAFTNFQDNKKVISATIEGTDFKDMYADIKADKNTQKLINTIAVNAGPNKLATTSSIVSSVEALTYQYMVNEQMDKKDAIKKASERISSEFDLLREGTQGDSKYYLYGKKGSMGNIEVVEKWLDDRATSKEFLGKKALVVGQEFRQSRKGDTEDELRDNWTSYVQSNAIWVTNDKADGARLMYRDEKTKQLVPVLTHRLDGGTDYIDVPYSDIQERARKLDEESGSFFKNVGDKANQGWQVIKDLFGTKKIEKVSKGNHGIAPDTNRETSTAANVVNEKWLDSTMDLEGESLDYADRSYTMDRLYAPKDPKGFLHSMRQSNFAFINNEVNRQIAGGSTVYEYDYKGKKVVSYLPLPPEKFNALSEEEKKAYYPTIEKAIKQTMRAWTRTSTLPEVTAFMKGKSLTQNEFFGVSDLWHVFGGSKLQGAQGKGKYVNHKKLGDMVKDKKWEEALKFIKDTPELNEEAGKNTKRFKQLMKYFGGNNA